MKFKISLLMAAQFCGVLLLVLTSSVERTASVNATTFQPTATTGSTTESTTNTSSTPVNDQATASNEIISNNSLDNVTSTILLSTTTGSSMITTFSPIFNSSIVTTTAPSPSSNESVVRDFVDITSPYSLPRPPFFNTLELILISSAGGIFVLVTMLAILICCCLRCRCCRRQASAAVQSYGRKQGAITYGYPTYNIIAASLTADEEKERTFPNSLRNRSGLKDSDKKENLTTNVLSSAAVTVTSQSSQRSVAINMEGGVEQ